MMLIGDNGLLNQAGKAKEITGIAEIKEAIDLSVTSALALDPLGDLTTENLETTLAQNMPTDYELSGDETSGWTVEVPSIDKIYGINSDGDVGEVNWIQQADGSIKSKDGKTTLQIGDYINYDAITGATETSYTSPTDVTGYSDDQIFNLSSYTDGWRVFGVENGQIVLISADTIGTGVDSSYPNADYILEGYVAYQYALTELQNICDLYGQGKYATGARSITVEDINKLTGYNPEIAKYGSGKLYEYGNEVTYTKSNGRIYYQGTISPTTLTSSIWTGSLMYLKDSLWHTIENDESVTLKSTYYEYYPNTLNDTFDVTATIGISNDSTLFKILFSKTGEMYWNDDWQDSSTNPTYYYYLGSRFISTGLDSTFSDAEFPHYGVFGVGNCQILFGEFESLGYSWTGNMGIRPLVTLQSSVIFTRTDDGSWDISE